MKIDLADCRIFFARLRICLYCGDQPGVLEILDNLFLWINSLSDYSLFRAVCKELNSVFAEIRARLIELNTRTGEVIDYELYQDVFQALTSYKKLFYTLCGQLTEYYSVNSPAIVNLIQYIQNHLDEPLNLSSLGKHVHFNTSYLSHLFKQEIGIGITTFINELRISRACSMLESTNLSISEISERIGFNDAKYFARLFHKAANLSPSVYRHKFSTAKGGSQRGWNQ